MDGPTLDTREGWSMLALAQLVNTIAAALDCGDEQSELADELRTLSTLWMAGARLRLGSTLRPRLQLVDA